MKIDKFRVVPGRKGSYSSISCEYATWLFELSHSFPASKHPSDGAPDGFVSPSQ